MIIYGIEIKEGDYENTVSIGGTLFTTDFLNLFCQDGAIMPHLYAIVEKENKTVTIQSYHNAESAAEYFAEKQTLDEKALADIQKWRFKVDNKGYNVPFESENIPDYVKRAIRMRLDTGEAADEAFTEPFYGF